MRGVKLADITWEEAQELINEDTILLLPIGGGSKEHGPHLPCGTDFYVVEEITKRVMARFPVVVLPTLPYAYYPAFVGWPGSVSLEAMHFINVVSDIIKSFLKFGVSKFLILDGGVSTHGPLRIMASDLHNAYGITVAVTDVLGLGYEVSKAVCEQKAGGHADEAETSCMLVVRPDLVKMDRAVEEYQARITGTHHNGVRKVSVRGKMNTKYGSNGNSKLATVEKGEKILEAKVQDIIYFLENFADSKLSSN